MTIEEALANIDIVVSNARMTRQEHISLQESIKLVTERCKLVDKFGLKEEDKQCQNSATKDE